LVANQQPEGVLEPWKTSSVACADSGLLETVFVEPGDGTVRNAELFLLRLEQHLKIKAFLSVGSHTNSLKIIATTASEFEEKTKRGNIIKNALREACSTSATCRFAVPNGQTSMLLQQVLEDQDASLVLGFHVGSSRSEASGPQCASIVLVVDRGSEAIAP